MKILIIDSLFTPFGGGQIISYNTYKMLKNNGYEMYYWAMDKQPYFDNDYEYTKYFTPYYNGSIDYIKNPIKYYYNYKAKKDLKNFIRLINPSIVHIHSTFGLSLSILNSCKNIPTVMTLHDSGLVCPGLKMLKNDNSYCKEQSCKNEKFINCFINKCCNKSIEASLRHCLLSYLNKKLLHGIDMYITPSNSLKELVLNANIGINENNIVTVNNFLSNDEIKDIQPNYNNKGYFLYIGRLSKEKGVHYLLEAMNYLPREIKLHIVGKGPEEENLKRYANLNNLDNVKFLGFKNREEIKEEYQNCIATILPCNWFEIFGMTNIESFINGKPVIASNIGGIPEIVEDNVNGLLFEPANVEQLKECILKYWNNPDLVIEHGKNGYKKAITQYTEERYYKELMQVYEETINECKK